MQIENSKFEHTPLNMFRSEIDKIVDERARNRKIFDTLKTIYGEVEDTLSEQDDLNMQAALNHFYARSICAR